MFQLLIHFCIVATLQKSQFSYDSCGNRHKVYLTNVSSSSISRWIENSIRITALGRQKINRVYLKISFWVMNKYTSQKMKKTQEAKSLIHSWFRDLLSKTDCWKYVRARGSKVRKWGEKYHPAQHHGLTFKLIFKKNVFFSCSLCNVAVFVSRVGCPFQILFVN